MGTLASVSKNNPTQKWPWIVVVFGVVLLFVGGGMWWTGRTPAGPEASAEITTAATETNASAETSSEATVSNDFIDLALERAQAEDVAGALDALDIAIASAPEIAYEAYYYRGLIQAEQGDLDAALVDFDKGIAANQHKPELFAARATTYASLGRPATALEDFNKAIQLAPSHAATYVNRGQAYQNMGEPDLAMEDYNVALDIDETLVAAWFNRGVLYLERSEPEKALADFEVCIEIDPGAPAPFFNRAVAYMELNDFDSAAADLTLFMGLSDDEYTIHQADALLQSLVGYEQSHFDGDITGDE